MQLDGHATNQKNKGAPAACMFADTTSVYIGYIGSGWLEWPQYCKVHPDWIQSQTHVRSQFICKVNYGYGCAWQFSNTSPNI